MARESATGAADDEDDDEDDDDDDDSSGAAAGSSALSDFTEAAAASEVAFELDAAADDEAAEDADEDAADSVLPPDGVRGLAGEATGADRDDGVTAVIDTVIVDEPAAAAEATVSDDADCELLGELILLLDDDDDDEDRQSAIALWYSASFGNNCGRRASSCPPSILTMSRSVSLRTRCKRKWELN